MGPGDGEHVQGAGGEVRLAVGLGGGVEEVEAAGDAGVLGLVDGERGGVHGDRLVGEAAHRLERHRRTHRPRDGGDVVDVAVGCDGPVWVVSSHVSHEPHGVGPPAQLRMVPDRLGVTTGFAGSSGSKTIVVVPPAAAGVVGGDAERVPLLCSWLRTSTTVPSGPGKAAMPSWAPGVGSPLAIGEPTWPNA